ncbi:hypothetical protein STIAU_7950 [Stigmatella aurantiaca DW4/3-1]|uniref:Uncharacterized protein n=1 Tax=Stigmatella aurantiaca (strain DW4/3-1) TaxID=378806 RepID=Q09C79_STIAD|nr:hypothetical protein STIAU_7950 [Stigmatella aurantiaca DW4/3-1]
MTVSKGRPIQWQWVQTLIAPFTDTRTGRSAPHPGHPSGIVYSLTSDGVWNPVMYSR